MVANKDNLNDLLQRGVVEAIDVRHLGLRLGRPKPLRVKLGIDATAHDLHLGHVVTLRKLRAFQRAGHRAVLIIGDFTAQIGDPSDRGSARQPLTLEQTRSYAKTYLEQAGKILDLRRTEVRYNSEWLGEFKPREFFHLLSTMTVQQLMAHETFAKRLDKGQPLGAHEIMYPLMQGYDSVAVEADVELGGTDQKFNLLAGRDVQKAYDQEPQDVVMMEYLIGTDGREKMSKPVATPSTSTTNRMTCSER
jgi:tyrosyl-tRNA synthetase